MLECWAKHPHLLRSLLLLSHNLFLLGLDTADSNLGDFIVVEELPHRPEGDFNIKSFSDSFAFVLLGGACPVVEQAQLGLEDDFSESKQFVGFGASAQLDQTTGQVVVHRSSVGTVGANVALTYLLGLLSDRLPL